MVFVAAAPGIDETLRLCRFVCFCPVHFLFPLCSFPTNSKKGVVGRWSGVGSPPYQTRWGGRFALVEGQWEKNEEAGEKEFKGEWAKGRDTASREPSRQTLDHTDYCQSSRTGEVVFK
jgi:hypothetical protein